MIGGSNRCYSILSLQILIVNEHGTFLFNATEGKVLLLGYIEVKLNVHDLLTGLCTIVIAHGASMVDTSGFNVRLVDGSNVFIENGNVSSFVPNAYSIVHILTLPADIKI